MSAGNKQAGPAAIVIASAVAAVIGLPACDAAGASFEAAVSGYAVISPADLAVTVRVTNTGKTAATPTCTVSAHDASYAYHGVDTGTLKDPVQPGQTVTFVDNLVITDEGAQYVTQADVTC